jgi:multiple sugar transport system substrate-binding protein
MERICAFTADRRDNGGCHFMIDRPTAPRLRCSRRRFLAMTAAVAGGASLAGSCHRARSVAGDAQAMEFWSWGMGGGRDSTQRYWEYTAAAFARTGHRGRINVVGSIPHAHYTSVLGTRFIGGNAPDIMVLDDSTMVELAEENLLLPLDDLIRADRTFQSNDFAPSMIAASQVNQRRYSVPLSGSWVHLIYRTDLFAAASLAPPQTWSDAIEVGKALQLTGMRYPLALEPRDPFWVINFIWQSGGAPLSDDYRHVTLLTPEALAGLQFVHDLVYKERLVDPASTRGTGARELWSTGSAAMLMDGGWMLGRYDTLYPQLIGKWEVIPLPVGRIARSFYGGAHIAINRDCKMSRAAWDFISYATRPASQMRLTEFTGSTPANLAAFKLPEFRTRFPHIARMEAAVHRGYNTPLLSFFSRMWYDVFKNSVLDLIMQDPRADIPAAVRAATPAMQAIVDDYWQRRRSPAAKPRT